MNQDIAVRLAGVAIAATTGWNDEASILLTHEIMSWPDEAAGVDAINEVCHEWPHLSHPPLGRFTTAYHEAVSRRTRERQLTEGSVRRGGCDGTGWIKDQPCRHCNPYLFDIYEDPPRWERYISGTPLHLLHDEVKLSKVHGAERMTTERGMPTPCKVDTFHDPAAQSVDVLTGVAAAERGYEELCHEEGREPNWDYFNGIFGGVIRRAQDRPLR